jgi:hypothetical protein
VKKCREGGRGVRMKSEGGVKGRTAKAGAAGRGEEGEGGEGRIGRGCCVGGGKIISP